MSALQATAPKTTAAPQRTLPVMRRAPPQSRYAAPPLASLAAIPASPSIQRKCAACDKEEESGVQPRLEVGPVGDRYEREADGIAAHVMAMPDSGASMTADAAAAGAAVQRACGACSSSRDEPRARRFAEPKEEEKDIKVRARRGGGNETIAASDGDLSRGGAPLPESTRTFFESRLGRDLGDVRVHQGSDSQDKNKSISARAFTYKNHIWLGAGEDAGPSFTMAHELAHVMQQTSPGPVGPQMRGASDTDPAVQRRESPFWLPGKTIAAKPLHESMHDAALDEIRKIKSNILTEVPIPGANRGLIDVGARGRADIYTADGTNPTVPGVEQVVAAPKPAGTDGSDAPADPAATSPSAAPAVASITELGNFSPLMVTSPMKQGSSVIVQDTRRAPKIENKRLTLLSSAPTNILIGEMKPAHDMDYRKSGAKQVANYIAGIAGVETKVNAVADAMRENDRWKANPKVIDTSTLIPAGWDASKPHSDWGQQNLKIRHYTPDKAKVTGGAKAKPKAKDAHQGRPKAQPIRGRWMMTPDNAPGHQGVIVYFLAANPQDLANALKPSSTRKLFRDLAAKIKKIQTDLITAPKATAGPAKPTPLRLSQPLPSVTPASPQVARKEVKDTFKAADWEAARTGNGVAKGTTDDSLLAKYGAAADDTLREEIAEQGAMVEWLKTKPPTPGVTYPDKDLPDVKALGDDLTLLKSADFWTSFKARPFGILREKFGLFFVKAYEKMSAFGKTVKDKFKGVSEGKILAGKSGTILKAAAKVAAVVLPRLVKPFLAKMLDTIIDCGVRGFEAKFRELIEGTIIDDVIQTAEELQAKVDTLATDVEAFFKGVIDRTIGPIATEFEDFIGEAKLALDVAKMIAEITKAIRIGSCVAGLVSAPETVGIGAIVGCGFALGDYILSKLGLSPVDHLIGTILSSCEMQNKIGGLMAGLTFVKSLPGRAGAAIVNEVKSLLSNNQTLKDLGVFKGKTYAQHASELFCNPSDTPFPEMGYEPTDCSDTGPYPRSKTYDYDVPDTIPRYDGRKPIPPEELPWMDTEVPKGREGEQIPQQPQQPQTPVTPPAPPPADEGDDADTPDTPQTGQDKGNGGGGSKAPVLAVETKKIDKLDPHGSPVGIFFIVHPTVSEGGWAPGTYDKTGAYKLTLKTTEATFGPSGPVNITIHKIHPANPPNSGKHRIEFTINEGVRVTHLETGDWLEVGTGRRNEYTQVGLPQ